MTDHELLDRFENATLDKGEFSHRDHVRVAWLYLRDQPLLEVLDQFPRRLRHLASTLGADGLYHETITWFFLLLVHDRIVKCRERDCWETFAAANPDLFSRSSEIMNASTSPKPGSRMQRSVRSSCRIGAPRDVRGS